MKTINDLLLILKSRGFPVDQSALNPEFKYLFPNHAIQLYWDFLNDEDVEALVESGLSFEQYSET